MRKMFSKKQIEKMIKSVSVENINELINIYSEAEMGTFQDLVEKVTNSSQKHYLEEGEEIIDICEEAIVGDHYIDNSMDYLCLYKDDLYAIFIDAGDDSYFYIDSYIKDDNQWTENWILELERHQVSFLANLFANASQNASNVMIKPSFTSSYDSATKKFTIHALNGWSFKSVAILAYNEDEDTWGGIGEVVIDQGLDGYKMKWDIGDTADHACSVSVSSEGNAPANTIVFDFSGSLTNIDEESLTGQLYIEYAMRS